MSKNNIKQWYCHVVKTCTKKVYTYIYNIQILIENVNELNTFDINQTQRNNMYLNEWKMRVYKSSIYIVRSNFSDNFKILFYVYVATIITSDRIIIISLIFHYNLFLIIGNIMYSVSLGGTTIWSYRIYEYSSHSTAVRAITLLVLYSYFQL